MTRAQQKHRVPVDLSAKHMKMLGRIRNSLGRWGNPATATSALRVAIEVLDEQLHPKRTKDEPEEPTQNEPGVASGLL